MRAFLRLRLSFSGALNPVAKRLTLQLAQLSVLTNLKLEIPLGRNTADLKLEGRLANAGETNIDLIFTLTNEGGNYFIAQFRGDDVTLTDDVGGTYAITNSPGLTVSQLGPNQSQDYSFSFKGPLDPKAKSLTLLIGQLSGTPNVKVVIAANQ